MLVNVGDGDFVLRATRGAYGDWEVDQDVPYSKSGAKVVPDSCAGSSGAETATTTGTSQRIAVGRLVPLRQTDGQPDRSRARAGRREDRLLLLRLHPADSTTPPRRPCTPRHGCGTTRRYRGRHGPLLGLDRHLPVRTSRARRIDVTDVPDGSYRLWLEVDEQRWFREATARQQRDLGRPHARQRRRMAQRSVTVADPVRPSGAVDTADAPGPLTRSEIATYDPERASGGCVIGESNDEGGGMRKIFDAARRSSSRSRFRPPRSRPRWTRASSATLHRPGATSARAAPGTTSCTTRPGAVGADDAPLDVRVLERDQLTDVSVVRRAPGRTLHCLARDAQHGDARRSRRATSSPGILVLSGVCCKK